MSVFCALSWDVRQDTSRTHLGCQRSGASAAKSCTASSFPGSFYPTVIRSPPLPRIPALTSSSVPPIYEEKLRIKRQLNTIRPGTLTQPAATVEDAEAPGNFQALFPHSCPCTSRLELFTGWEASTVGSLPLTGGIPLRHSWKNTGSLTDGASDRRVTALENTQDALQGSGAGSGAASVIGLVQNSHRAEIFPPPGREAGREAPERRPRRAQVDFLSRSISCLAEEAEPD